jgi:tRNA pseudouridine13 synthase
MKFPDFEKNIGIKNYLTSTSGINGKLRSQTKDFIVEEIFQYPKEKEDGGYVVAEILSKNWETHTLVRTLSKKLHISRKRIGFAGTKDKRSHSNQLMSFQNISKEKLSNLKIKDVEINNIYKSDKPIKIGKLHGNGFKIIIRKIDKNITSNHIKKTISQLDNQGGFPNYYGIQRFGVIRPITHLVGRYITHGDFKKAAMTYIANPMEEESKETFEVRHELEQTLDYSKALHSYPNYLNFEKAILNKLANNPDDFVSALKELPKNLLTMFINAYQSYLFNKILSKRISKKIPLNKAIIGDIILPVRKSSENEKAIYATQSNIEKVNKQVSKNKAFVSGLLIGYSPNFSKGEMGEIEHKIIEEEKIDYRDFVIPEISFISSQGSRRAILAKINNLNWTLQKDDMNKDKQALSMKFELKKGCYATSFLREIMKSKEATNY